MLGRIVAAVVFTLAVSATASAQDVKLPEEKYGFQVTKLTNATRRDITGAFNRLRQTLTEKDNLLVYYAGHPERGQYPFLTLFSLTMH